MIYKLKIKLILIILSKYLNKILFFFLKKKLFENMMT